MLRATRTYTHPIIKQYEPFIGIVHLNSFRNILLNTIRDIPNELNLVTTSGYHFIKVSWDGCLIRALVPYSQLLLLSNHAVIVVKLGCVEGLMEDRCIANKHSR